MTAPKWKAGDRVRVKPCMWEWHVGRIYVLYGEPWRDDAIPDGDEWWYFIEPDDGSGGRGVLPESVLEAAP